MPQMALTEWVAVYGAVLSTVIAIVATVRYLLEGPRLGVMVLKPKRDRGIENGSLTIVVYNAKALPTVVASIHVRFFEGTVRVLGVTLRKGREIGGALFDDNSTFRPARKGVRQVMGQVVGEPGARILSQGDELSYRVKPIKNFDPDKHWVLVEAKSRLSSRLFRGWASPEFTQGAA